MLGTGSAWPARDETSADTSKGGAAGAVSASCGAGTGAGETGSGVDGGGGT